MGEASNLLAVIADCFGQLRIVLKGAQHSKSQGSPGALGPQENLRCVVASRNFDSLIPIILCAKNSPLIWKTPLLSRIQAGTGSICQKGRDEVDA